MPLSDKEKQKIFAKQLCESYTKQMRAAQLKAAQDALVGAEGDEKERLEHFIECCLECQKLAGV